MVLAVRLVEPRQERLQLGCELIVEAGTKASFAGTPGLEPVGGVLERLVGQVSTAIAKRLTLCTLRLTAAK